MPREDKGAGVGREWALEVARGDLRAARGEVLGCGGGILFFLELHTTVIPVIFSVSVFPGIRYSRYISVFFGRYCCTGSFGGNTFLRFCGNSFFE